MSAALKFQDFEARLAKMASIEEPQLKRTAAADGIDLAYKVFQPVGDFNDMLVLYHGGGANMRGGYAWLAAELAGRAPLAVCLTDMRGHGLSGGRRGHTDPPAAVWRDVDCIATRVARDFPGVAIHLGGHSSAAGMLLNYRTIHQPQADVRSLVLLAPEFGFRANLYRTSAGSSGSFGRANIWPFLLNAFSAGRLGGSLPAVRLNYEDSRLASEIGCISSYSVNMALAVTPNEPARQLARLDLPTWVGIAEDDELIDAAKLDAFLVRHSPSTLRRRVIPGATHLGVILEAVAPILAAMGFDAEHMLPTTVQKS